MPCHLKLELRACSGPDNVIGKEVLILCCIQSHLNCSAARPITCSLFSATLDPCQENIVIQEPLIHLSVFPTEKWYPFKRQVDTDLLTSGVQAMISGSLPGTEVSLVTQQNCNMVGRVDHTWGSGPGAVTSILSFL